MRVTTGWPDSTSTGTDAITFVPAESMAAKPIVWLPICVPAGFHRNSPLAASNSAPIGSVAAVKVAAGSLADTWKRSSAPGLAYCRPGTRIGLVRSGVTVRVVCTTSVPILAATTIPSAALTASIWNSTADCPGRVRILAGSCSDALELESRTSAVVSFCTLRRVIRHWPCP